MSVFLGHILRFCVVMLLSAFGTNMAFAVPTSVSNITYFQPETTHSAQGGDVGFAARAPPLAIANVAVTGGITAIQGGAFSLHGHEAVAALFGFGVGLDAPNRVATQADVAESFQQNRRFWTDDPVNFNGNRVYQRNDLIDPNRVDPVSGRTNLELMQAGRAPLGPDGKPVNLHHLTQSQSGAIAEVTQTLHSNNHGVLHMPNTVPSGINRTEFNAWRRNYWRNRANDF